MKRISKNFIAIIGSDIARRILGMLAIAFLARKVGTEYFGIINIGFTVFSYGLMVSSLGLNAYGTRAIAQEVNAGLVSKIVSIKLTTGLLTFLSITAIVLFFVPSVVTSKFILVLALSLFANALLLDWFYQGKERMGIIGVGRITSATIYLILIIVFVGTPDDLVWVAGAAVIGDIVASAISWYYYRRTYRGNQFQFSMTQGRSLIAASLPIGLGSILANISVNLPILILGIIMSNYEAGIYSAASKLVFFLLMLDRVLATLLLPAASRLHNYSKELLVSTLSIALKWIVLASLPVCVGGMMLADRLIPLVFGPEYMPAIAVFQILIWFFQATILHTIYTSALLAIGEEKSYSNIMGLSVVLYTVLIVICTKFFGVFGAAGAMVVAETATLFLMERRVRQFMQMEYPPSILKIILSAAIMGLVIMQFPLINIVIVIPVGAVVYAVALLFSRAITISEVTHLFKRF